MSLDVLSDLSPEARAEAAAVAEITEIAKELDSFAPKGRASFRMIALRLHTEPSWRLFEKDQELINESSFKLQVIVPAVLRDEIEKVGLVSEAIDTQFTEVEAKLNNNLKRARAMAATQGVIALDGDINVEPVRVKSYSQGFARWCSMLEKMDEVCYLVDSLWHHSRIDTQSRHREQNELRNILVRFRRKLIVECLQAMRFAANQKRDRVGGPDARPGFAVTPSAIEAPERDANYENRVKLAAEAAGLGTKRPARVRSKKGKGAPAPTVDVASVAAVDEASVPVAA